MELTLAAFAVAGLVAWRWWLDDRKLHRAHELALSEKRAAVDEKAAEDERARYRLLEGRVRDLEYARQKR